MRTFYKVGLNALVLWFVVFSISACKWGNNVEKKYLLKYGNWRGELQTAGGALPFLFELKMINDSVQEFSILNDKEVVTTRDVLISGDSIIIQMPVFESVLIATISARGDSLIGQLMRTKYDSVNTIAFKGIAGGDSFYKFSSNAKGLPKDFSGNWEIAFAEEDGETPALGVFTQEGITVSGSVLTPTGDYRFLSGIADGDSLFLSGFDGSGVYMFKAHLDNSILKGHLYSGAQKITDWRGKKNDAFVLPDPKKMTHLKPGVKGFGFSLPDVNGKMISLSNPEYQNKVVILQILGSWCPNCMDETKFLAEFYTQNKSKNVEVIGLAFERTAMKEKAIDNIKKLMKYHGVTYPIAYAGTTSKEDLTKALPELEKVLAFPTTIVLDKAHNVKYIHTGFSGPGTGVHYDNFKKEFSELINGLL